MYKNFPLIAQSSIVLAQVHGGFSITLYLVIKFKVKLNMKQILHSMYSWKEETNIVLMVIPVEVCTKTTVKVMW
jgi:hypothetical protein